MEPGQAFTEHSDAVVRLAALSRKVRLDLTRLDYPRNDWVPPMQHPTGAPVLDVVIVGAGQGGLGVGLALWRARIRNILIVDQAADGAEGPWNTFARMQTLRTPKYLTGPDTGIADLTFPAWFAARFSAPAWEALERIPRLMWMDYLRWCRATLELPIQNEVRLVSVEPGAQGCLALTLDGPRGSRRVLTRKLVLANGLEGSGQWHTPPALSAHLPKTHWMHTSERADFSAFKGKRIGVLGIGASAVDCAATAAEAGAAEVRVFYRRAQPPFGERRTWVENTGFLSHFADLPDAQRWRAMHAYFSAGTPAPKWSMARLAAQPQAHLHPGEGWDGTGMDSGAVKVTTAKDTYTFDHLIFGTGIRVDLSLRPELSAFRGQIATWGDRYDPPGALRDTAMAHFPYLGRGATLTERKPGTAPHLGAIHVFNWGATLSMGISSASITGMKFGLQRIVSGIIRDFYADIADDHIDAFPRPPE